MMRVNVAELASQVARNGLLVGRNRRIQTVWPSAGRVSVSQCQGGDVAIGGYKEEPGPPEFEGPGAGAFLPFELRRFITPQKVFAGLM
jgi:hypothetical protein